MALATWWSPDPLPELPALPGFEAARAIDDTALAGLNRLAVTQVQARRQSGHHPYVGLLDGTPVAYGWVATREASIGELKVSFRLPPGFQGQGIYPQLLQAILKQEALAAKHFWIIHAPENTPSAGLCTCLWCAGYLGHPFGKSACCAQLNKPACRSL